MFFSLTVLAATLSLASARAVPRSTAPANWWSGLESYDAYHSRYEELSCSTQHGSAFFTSCCHPRLADVDLSTIPDDCLSSADFCDEGSSSSAPEPSTAPVNVAPAPTTTKAEPTTTTHHTTTSTHKASPTSSPPSSGNTLKGSGQGTYFTQNGVAGACGKVHPDSAKVVALDTQLYGNTGEASQYCGKTITITNTNNGKTVTAIVADACPTCGGKDYVDMSVGAFTEIATEEEGEVPITWVMDL